MADLLHHKVRFGDLSFGPFVHFATFFDLLIVATEELSYRLGYPVEEVVEAGGVPYAPVAVRADVERYPRYEDTVVVALESASTGASHAQLGYRFRRASDGAAFGRATMVQVTITPEGTAEPIAPVQRQRLEALGSAEREPVRIDPRPPAGRGPRLSRQVVFRTPQLEAAGLGYFEEYARELSCCLEAFLDERGPSLGELTEGTYPFLPVAWELTLEHPIRFEDEVSIEGRVLDVDPSTLVVAYELRRAAPAARCIRAAVTYGCFDDGGRRVPFPPEAVAAVEGPQAT